MKAVDIPRVRREARDPKIVARAVHDHTPLRPGDPVPTRVQWAWLRRGLDAPGGKLPLFDRDGREVPRRLIEAAMTAGWAEPWFVNPIKPDWLVCRLTQRGREVVTFLERFR